MAVDTPMQEINLATEKGKQVAKELFNKDQNDFEWQCRIESFLKTLTKPPLRYNLMPVFAENNCSIFNKDRVLYTFGHAPHHTTDKNAKCIGRDEMPAGVILTDCATRTPKNNDYRVLMLINADDIRLGIMEFAPNTSLMGRTGATDMPAASFSCLTRFWADPIHEKDYFNLAKRLASGEVKLLDYTIDEQMEMSKADKKKLKKANLSTSHSVLFNSPKIGFSPISITVGGEKEWVWHRSGSCLFHDTKRDQYILLGQDEGTYFGCQLPSKVETISDAYIALTPAAVHGKEYVRQGEWFMIEVPEKDVPATRDCVIQVDTSTLRGYDAVCVLPMENEDSNKHWIKTTDGRVGKDGLFYAYNPSIDHDQHALIELQGWWTFYRNTALRSYSEQGVD